MSLYYKKNFPRWQKFSHVDKIFPTSTKFSHDNTDFSMVTKFFTIQDGYPRLTVKHTTFDNTSLWKKKFLVERLCELVIYVIASL